MPKLLVFLPCEKVIIDQDNNPSVITLLQEISINVRVAEKLHELADAKEILAPLRWSIFSLWGRESTDDPDTQFEESSDLVMPDGRVAVPSRTVFKLSGPSHRSITQIMGFPLFQTPGVGQLRIFLRQISEHGDAEEARQVASFPLRLKHHSSDK